MRTVPETTVSSLDVYRLYNLLDALPAGSFAGKEKLLEELSRARLLAPADMPPTVVTMNSTVKYTIKPSRKVIEQTLVYPEDLGTRLDAISIFTPIGSALLGSSPGDSIRLPQSGGGYLTISVKEVIYQPERAGKFYI
jgi:regulator of nucleoside diphosphate kinase